MDEKMSKETAEHGDTVQAQEKGKQTGLLVLLLLLLGGFGYLYFFTGLIRPQEAPPVPQLVPQVVKQPLPVRDVTSKDAITSTPAVLPVAPTASVVTPPPPKTVDAKVTAASSVKSETQKIATLVKPAAQPEPVKGNEKKVAAAAQAAQAQNVESYHKKTSPPKPGGPWTVVAGLYVVEEVLAADLSKVKKAGLTPVMISGPKRSVTMHRLFLKECATRQEAQQALESVRRSVGSGFSLQRGDKHDVFVGSYAVLSGAQAEQQRLSAAGIKVTVKKSQVALASRKLTAGTFTDRKAADEAIKKLKAVGVGTPTLE